ncbi:MAG: hypothetical protein V1800_11005, partial [Candidatus Latescibacterota bacterium]
MNTGQMLLVLGAMVLLSSLVLSVNRSVLENTDMVAQAGYRIAATALGQALIEEAGAKAFDEEVVGTPPTGLPAGFTAPGTLGTDLGESYPGFDDVDDFQGFESDVITADSVGYHLSVQVGYVDSDDPDTVVPSRTFFKKMDVT